MPATAKPASSGATEAEKIVRDLIGADELEADLAELDRLVDEANLRLDLTREALRAALGSETRYRYVIAAIEEAVDGAGAESAELRVIGNLDNLVNRAR